MVPPRLAFGSVYRELRYYERMVWSEHFKFFWVGPYRPQPLHLRQEAPRHRHVVDGRTYPIFPQVVARVRVVDVR